MLALAPSRFDRPPMGEDLARQMAGEIIRLRLAPGTKLVETEVCAQRGVSRSPLREALRLLEFWSLVQRRPRFGVRVAPMSQANLDDLVTCRIPLEARAAALVAGQPDHAALAAALSAHLQTMRGAAKAGDAEGCFAANLAFMDSLHAANPNPVLGRLLAELNMPAQRYRYLVYRYAPGMLGRLMDANARLADAIAAGDGPGALAVTEAMVLEAWQHLRPQLPDYLARAAAEAAA